MHIYGRCTLFFRFSKLSSSNVGFLWFCQFFTQLSQLPNCRGTTEMTNCCTWPVETWQCGEAGKLRLGGKNASEMLVTVTSSDHQASKLTGVRQPTVKITAVCLPNRVAFLLSQAIFCSEGRPCPFALAPHWLLS